MVPTPGGDSQITLLRAITAAFAGGMALILVLGFFFASQPAENVTELPLTTQNIFGFIGLLFAAAPFFLGSIDKPSSPAAQSLLMRSIMKLVMREAAVIFGFIIAFTSKQTQWLSVLGAFALVPVLLEFPSKPVQTYSGDSSVSSTRTGGMTVTKLAAIMVGVACIMALLFSLDLSIRTGATALVVVVIIAGADSIRIYFKYRLDPNFNKDTNWQTFPEEKDLNLFTALPVPLEEGEDRIAAVDFRFYPQGSAPYYGSQLSFLLSNVSSFLNIITLTSRRLIMTRHRYYSTQVKCRSIPFSEIENVHKLKFPGSTCYTLKLSSGETYRFCLNQRIGDSADAIIMDFLDEQEKNKAEAI